MRGGVEDVIFNFRSSTSSLSFMVLKLGIADCDYDSERGRFESATSPLWLFCGTLETRKLMAAVQMRKVRPKIKGFPFIGLKNGVEGYKIHYFLPKNAQK